MTQLRLPVDTNIHEHWCRFDLLIDYTDLLPTTTATPEISQEDRKQYFFETFPSNGETILSPLKQLISLPR